MKATIVILAGGKSSRMGSDKGLIDFKGQPMIKHVIDAVKLLNLPIIIIANDGEYRQFGYPVFEDLVKEKGPVGGIYTALFNSKSDKNIVISCDTPFVTKELLSRLVIESKGMDVIIPSWKGKEHPLIGVYDKRIAPHLKARIDLDQLKLRLAYKELKYKVIPFLDADEGIDGQVFTNVNTKEELKSLEL